MVLTSSFKPLIYNFRKVPMLPIRYCAFWRFTMRNVICFLAVMAMSFTSFAPTLEAGCHRISLCRRPARRCCVVLTKCCRTKCPAPAPVCCGTSAATTPSSDAAAADDVGSAPPVEGEVINENEVGNNTGAVIESPADAPAKAPKAGAVEDAVPEPPATEDAPEEEGTTA